MSTLRNYHRAGASHEWSTPRELFDRLALRFAFTVDVCATAANAKCPQFFTAQQDGLRQTWTGVCWCNPPYGPPIKAWVRKAWETAYTGQATVVCLLPVRTDTSWWHDYVLRGGEVEFLRGRIRFNAGRGRAPFPSAVVVFHRAGATLQVPA